MRLDIFKAFCPVLFIVLFFSCKAQYMNVQRIDTSILNSSLLEEINNYKTTYPMFKSILIMSDNEENWIDGYKYNNYWIIGPAYDNLVFLNGKSPSMYFKYDNLIIFIQSSLDGLTNPTIANDIYRKYSIPFHPNDRMNREEKFYKHALLCEQELDGSFNFVSNRLDTFFLKKQVEFIPPPVSEEQ